MTLEDWKPVSDFEGFYEVSSWGRVRRSMCGHGSRVGRIIKPVLINSGYLVYHLHVRNCAYQRLAHRLVAEAFLGQCPKGHEVNHKNRNKLDNRPENLEYLTRSANLLHRSAVGIGRGEDNGTSKLTEEIVRDIRKRYRYGGGPGYKALAYEYGVSWEAIRQIIKRYSWAWVEE